MTTDNIMWAVVVMITTTIIASRMAKKLNLGSIAALLIVGMALGPHSPKPLLPGHTADMQAVGEIGVILLLFLVGLYTQPKKFLSARRLVFGLGTAQYFFASTAIAVLLMLMRPGHWPFAVIIGLGLAMSSDAVAISNLEDRGQSTSPQGKAVMAVVIYQGFIVIAVLAVIPL